MSFDSQRLFSGGTAERSATALWVRIAIIQSGVALRLPPQSKEGSSHEQLS
jgi:hypothetical protein